MLHLNTDNILALQLLQIHNFQNQAEQQVLDINFLFLHVRLQIKAALYIEYTL